MQVSVVIEERFFRTPDGVIWSATPYRYAFWRPYLEVFNRVRIIARVQSVSKPASTWKRADGAGLLFEPIPDYQGPFEALRKIVLLKKALSSSVPVEEGVILRVPSALANLLFPILKSRRQAYAVEVIGDPWDLFSPRANTYFTPIRAIARRWFVLELRRQCRGAIGASYVTQKALQQRYPPGPNTYATSYSDVELPPEAYVGGPRLVTEGKNSFVIIFVGTLNQLYKAPDVVIDAFALCKQRGFDVRLVMIGDGRFKPFLEQRVASYGLQKFVHFVGQLPPGEAIRKRLDQADLFVLPSWQEGLPRAMLEAMARALPCIGSNVGGIPELLHEDDLVPPGDPVELANKMCYVLRNPEVMRRMSYRNYRTALRYSADIMLHKRVQFYRYLREYFSGEFNGAAHVS